MGKTPRRLIIPRAQKSSAARSHGRDEARPILAGITSLWDRASRSFTPQNNEYVFDMQGGKFERERMINLLWEGKFDAYLGRLVACNPELADVFDNATHNKYQPPDTDVFQRKKALKFENVLANLIRMKNVHMVPLLVLLRSVDAHRTIMHQEVWSIECALRLLMSRRWTEMFIEEALKFNPGPKFLVMPFVSWVLFDNFTMKVNHAAMNMEDNKGYKLDMTNWAKVDVPDAALPGANIAKVLAKNGGSMWRSNFDKESIVVLFHPEHHDITSYQSRRWHRSMKRVRAGTLFERNGIMPKHGKSSFTWMPPIFDRLQLLNEDVEFEMDVMRAEPQVAQSVVMFIGGDRLSTARVEWAILKNRPKYMESCPMVIPVIGEHPHGSHHILHAGWRLWRQFIDPMAAWMSWAWMMKEPNVSEYNHYDFALCVIVRAVAEFVQETVQHSWHTNDKTVLLDGVKHNLDMHYCVQFLDKFGFLYWNFRQAVRDGPNRVAGAVTPKNLWGDACEELDLTWRECLGTFLTGEANKTHYAPMAVMHIYRQKALLPELVAIMHDLRTFHLSEHPSTGVGCDCPIEAENKTIRACVHPPNETNVSRFINQLNFTQPVSDGLRSAFRYNREEESGRRMRDVDVEVEQLKRLLYRDIAYNGAASCGPLRQSMHETVRLPTTRSRLMTNISNTNRPPWRKAMESLVPPPHLPNARGYAEFVRSHLDSKAPWH